jgi:NMD protein affecting ribosome stability and mRNA decay
MGAILLKNIKKDKRICCKCGRKITGYGHFYVYTLGRGKYLCRDCDGDGHG